MAPRPSLLCILLLSAATAVLCTGEKSFENNLGKKELISAQAVRSISRKVLQDYGLIPAAAPALAPAPAPAPAPVAAGAGGNSTSVNGTSGNVTAPGFVYSPGIEYPFFPALFVFGDSLVDTGNSVYLGNPRAATPPYGVTPGGRLNVSGRFSNGPIISDYLATYLGLPLPNPILLPNGSFYSGANFASAGSGALNTTGTPGTVLPLYNQTQLFTNFVQASIAYWSNASAATTVSPIYPKPTSFQSALYMIVTGGNDLRGFTGNASAFPAFRAAVLTSLRSTIQTLYFSGARNFVFANIPQVGCAPGVRNFTANGVCEPTANAASQQLSLGFETLTQGLQTALPNATFVLFDAFNATAAAVAYPAAFGFTNSEDACCGSGGFSNSVTICGDPGATVCVNPNEYAFWDQLHPTTAYAQLLAKEIFGGSTFVHPKNVLESFGLPKLQAK